MDGDPTPPLPPMGRGGRGAAILRALQSSSRQPGTAGSSLPGQQPALPPPVVVSIFGCSCYGGLWVGLDHRPY